MNYNYSKYPNYPFLKKTWNKNRHKHIFQLFEKYKQPKYPTKLGYLHRSTHISIC